MEDTSNSEEDTAQGDRSSSAQDIADSQTKECPEDASDGVSGHDLTLNCRVGIVESAEEVWVGEQSAEDALVVACIERQYRSYFDRGLDHCIIEHTEQHESEAT